MDDEKRKKIEAGQAQTDDECPFCGEVVSALGKHLPDCAEV